MATSFLHAAAAKIKADKIGSGSRRGNNCQSDTLKLLLVEDDNDYGTTTNTASLLAHSLLMDTAYSIVSKSSTPCRGCSSSNISSSSDYNNNNNENNKGHNTSSVSMTCKCCKVAMLIVGEVPKNAAATTTTKKKRRSGGYGNNIGGRREFPIPCMRMGDVSPSPTTYTHLLHNIQIKYITSLPDAIRYLAYAPSLPDCMQPLDGIFILGLGDLVSRGRGQSIELTHLLSMLSDTANILHENKMKLPKEIGGTMGTVGNGKRKYSCESVSIVATIDKFTLSSIPQKVIRYLPQWIDYIASISPTLLRSGSGNDDTMAMTFTDEETGNNEYDHDEWAEVVFKEVGMLERPVVVGKTAKEHRTSSFKFKLDIASTNTNESIDSSQIIVWKV